MNKERKRQRKSDLDAGDPATAKLSLTLPVGPVDPDNLATDEELMQQSLAVAQLHTASSFYHKFRKLVSESDRGVE